MAERLFGCYPLLRVDLEHLPEQVHGELVDLLILGRVQVEGAASVLIEYFVVGLPLEEALAEEEEVEDESETEDIADGRVLGLHVLDIDDLGCHVARGAAPHEQVLLRICELSQPVVRNHALVTLAAPQQDVLRLEVAVHDVLAVHLLQPLQNAVDHELYLRGFELFLGLDSGGVTLILSKSCPPYSSSKMM